MKHAPRQTLFNPSRVVKFSCLKKAIPKRLDSAKHLPVVKPMGDYEACVPKFHEAELHSQILTKRAQPAAALRRQVEYSLDHRVKNRIKSKENIRSEFIQTLPD